MPWKSAVAVGSKHFATVNVIGLQANTRTHRSVPFFIQTLQFKQHYSGNENALTAFM